MKTALHYIGREEHDEIIKKGIALDGKLFAPLTLDSILAIESRLQKLRKQTGREYVAVPVGQPYGGPKRPMAIPKENVYAVHCAYTQGLQGVSPEIGRAYDLQAERERLKNPGFIFNPKHYPRVFLDFLRLCFQK